MRIVLFVFVICNLTSLSVLAQAPANRMTVSLNGHTPAQFKLAVRDLREAEGVNVLYNHDPVIRFAYASEDKRVAAMQLLYSRTYSVTTKDGMPADYPILPSTASAEEISAYNDQKLEWMENHPEWYESMQQSGEITVIPQEEFDQMPPQKQQVILDNPDLYSVE